MLPSEVGVHCCQCGFPVNTHVFDCCGVASASSVNAGEAVAHRPLILTITPAMFGFVVLVLFLR